MGVRPMVQLLLFGPRPAHVGAAERAWSPSFTIANDTFLRDGAPTQIVSGSFHYARAPRELWRDRLQRMRALGLNAVQTYVPWNWHETEEGSFNFGGAHDLAAFANMAREEDLLLLLRLGPYICGEWEFGGFPAWLLAVDPPVTLRTFEKQYIARVDSWFAELLPRVKPLLYANGGNVIMVQIENEFGSYGDVSTNPLDKQYLEHLLSLRVHLGQDISSTPRTGEMQRYDRGS